jgi:hypothetical protein
MGRTVLGSALVWLGLVAAVFTASSARAQAPTVPKEEPTAAAPPPAAEPKPPPAPAPAPAPVHPAPAAAPPPLYPPPPPEPGQRPTFLHTEEEMRELRPQHALRSRESSAVPGFVARSSPWVDFSLTSFYMDNRVGNFLNFGVQAGGYFFEHLRVSARVVAPLEEVTDNRNTYSSVGGFSGPGGSTFQDVRKASSRNMSLLYGASIGLVVTNDKSFVFGPSLAFVRTDVEDYGTAVLVALPFEWTTARNLRVGFELALGHASGGTARSACTSTTNGITTSCGVVSSDRQGGAVVLFQYNMGWALGRL